MYASTQSMYASTHTEGNWKNRIVKSYELAHTLYASIQVGFVLMHGVLYWLILNKNRGIILENCFGRIFATVTPFLMSFGPLES